ncbi:MAG: hypothetical protein WC901_04050 [Candidatus Margulisiibacteriota bacterium]
MKITFASIRPTKRRMRTMLALLEKLSRPQAFILAFTPNKQRISRGEYSYSTASTDPRLKTFGVVTCIALAIYSKDTKEGALAHIIYGDPFINDHLREVRAKFGSKEFEIQIISPQADRDFREKTAAAVQAVFGIEVKLGDMDPNATAYYDVRLNLSDGSVLVTPHQ